MSTFSENLRIERQKKKISQEKLGEMIGVSGVTIMRYEKGQREPKINVIKQIASALEIDFTALLSDEVKANYNNLDTTDSARHAVVTGEDNLNAYIEEYGTSALKIIAMFCRNARINQGLSEKCISEIAQIALKEYIDFETKAVNIGTPKIMSICNILKLNIGFIMGYMTASLLQKNNPVAVTSLLDRMDLDMTEKQFFYELFSLDSEQLHQLFPEIKKLLNVAPTKEDLVNLDRTKAALKGNNVTDID